MEEGLTQVGKAHQRIIREQFAKNPEPNLFGNYWEDINTDIKNGITRAIDFNTAKKIVEKYEWLGCMPAMVRYCFGIYFDGFCGGVTVFSDEYIENLGRWDKYGYTGRIILLSRGVCVHWAHPHTGSKLVMESIKLLPDKYDVITATTDKAAGEVGTIYQACNFFYVGSMRENNPKINYKERDRFGVRIGGKIYGARSIRQKIGTLKREEILKYWPNAEFIPQYSKHRYFYFRGSRTNRKHLKRAIDTQLRPYPKRN